MRWRFTSRERKSLSRSAWYIYQSVRSIPGSKGAYIRVEVKCQRHKNTQDDTRWKRRQGTPSGWTPTRTMKIGHFRIATFNSFRYRSINWPAALQDPDSRPTISRRPRMGFLTAMVLLQVTSHNRYVDDDDGVVSRQVRVLQKLVATNLALVRTGTRIALRQKLLMTPSSLQYKSTFYDNAPVSV